MSRPQGFAVYRSFSQRWDPDPKITDMPARPDGELVWIHASDPNRLVVVQDLIARLKSLRNQVQVLVTFDLEVISSEHGAVKVHGADYVIALKSLQQAQARQFAQHWRADACLWIGGVLRNTLLSTFKDMGTFLVLADIDEGDVTNIRRRWFPGRSGTTFDMFNAILVRDAATARIVRRHGVDPGRISVAGPLSSGALPPPCSDERLNELMDDFAARPVWLAVGVQREEIEPILSAHRKTIRLAHRLLLVMVLAKASDAAFLKKKLDEFSLRSSDWDNGDRVEDAIQVVFSGEGVDMGLWYRAIPLAFLGSSFSSVPEGIDPMPAAALGSALLKGPHTNSHVDAYTRLSRAGALETVRDAGALTTALIRLIAPDRAASMALSGWEVATEGAEMTDKLLDLLGDGLDRKEASGARA